MSELTPGTVTDEVWTRHVALVDCQLKYEVKNFALKLDLLNHIWNKVGNA